MTIGQTIQLNLPLNLTLSLSQDNFVELATADQDLRLERTVTGELIVNPPTGWETGKRNAKITYQLVKWVEELGGSGIAFDSSTGFRLVSGAKPESLTVIEIERNFSNLSGLTTGVTDSI